MTADPVSVATPSSAHRRRSRRFVVVGGVILAGVLAFVLLYFEPQSAFIDDRVSEILPGPDAATTTTTAATTPAPGTTTAALPANSVSGALASAKATGRAVVLSTATFVSGEHATSGTALVVALANGGIVVRFEGLATDNGPDLRVVLSPDVASQTSQYDDLIQLGDLKGNLGDQNYDVAADVDITGFRSVVIWCERFGVAFGAASVDVSV